MNLNENDQIKDVIWLDPEILPNPLPLGLTPPSQYYTREKNKTKSQVEKKDNIKRTGKKSVTKSSKVVFIHTDFFFLINFYIVYIFLASIISSLIVKQ